MNFFCRKNLSIIKLSRVLTVIIFVLSYSLGYSQNNKSSESGPKKKEISGSITDANTGEPLIGVSVVVDGTSKGTISDINGDYVLTVPGPDAGVTFTYVGFVSQSIVVGNQSTINIELAPDITAMDEVVVVGYGTTTKQNFTGSTTVTNIEDSPLGLIPNTNALDALRGVVPGLNISQATGAGQTGELLIRGEKNIMDELDSDSHASEPLIVLDGIIYMGNMRDIDPSSIESITVLKDAATVAVYGSRASNGVVMISTKEGKKGKPRITYKNTFGISKVINKADVLSTEDWIRKVNLLQGAEEDSDPTVWMSGFEGENYLAGKTTDWQDLVSRTGTVQNHNLSITGGTDNVNYYLGGSYNNSAGVLIGDDYSRTTITSRINSDITDWLEIGGNFNYSFNDYSGPTNYDIYQSIRMSPYGRVYRDEENELLEKYPAEEGIYRINPLWNVLSGTIDDHDVYYTTNIAGNATIKIPWIQGLKYKMNYSYTHKSIERDYFTHEGYYVTEYQGSPDTRYDADVLADGLTSANGYSARTKQVGWVWDNIISYSRIFGRHDITLTGVYTRDKYSHKYKKVEGSDFSDLGNTTLGYNGLTYAGVQEISDFTNWEKANVGYLGRVNYSYDSKYHISAAVRRDGASVFGDDHKWGTFPSFGLAWTVSEEGFMNSISQVNYLKLKFSYGVNGNQAIDAYATLSPIKLGPTGNYSYTFGNTSEVSWGQRIGSLGNTNLGWIETTAFNTGFELEMLQSRIGLDVDVYKSKTVDQIFERNVPVMGAGLNTMDATMGRVDNWGIEATLNTQNIVSTDWRWTSNLMYYMNRNKVVELYGDGQDDPGNSLFIGKSLGAIYGYNNVGILQTEGDEEYKEINSFEAGDVKFEDVDENDTINANDRVIKGYTKELFRLSFGNTVNYKNFELYFLLSGVFGGKDYYKAVNMFAYRTASDVTYDNNLNHTWWTEENQSDKYPSVDYTDSRYEPIQSRSFVRLQNLSLSYNFTQPWVQKLKISNLRVFVSATNLFTITNWEGGDPETGQSINYNSGDSKWEYGYPVSSTYSAGINLTL